MTKIDVTPNYKALFSGFLRDAKEKSAPTAFLDALPQFKFADEPSAQADALRAVQAFLAPLNIAAAAMSEVEDIAEFRAVLMGMVQAIDAYAYHLEDIYGDPTDGKGIL